MDEKIPDSISFILPVYNEANIIEDAVKHCMELMSRHFSDFEMIIIDDGSTDGTGEILERLAQGDKRIQFLKNNINLNVGISIQRGMVIATKKFVVHNAVDLPLSVEDTAELIRHAADCDVLVFERRSYGGYTLWRKITSKINRAFLRILFGYTGIRDMNYTQIYKRDALHKIMPLAKSPAFTTPEIILRAKRLGLRIKSITVDYQPRTVRKGAFGKSHDIFWSLYDMLRFRFMVWKTISSLKI